MKVTDADMGAVPSRNVRVPRQDFLLTWLAASERADELAASGVTDWYVGGVATTCRWLATAPSRLPNGLVDPTPAPATRRTALAYEELIEQEFLAAERLAEQRPDLVESRPGWCEGVLATLRWAWRREGPAPVNVEIPAGK
ncbi:hypothetical protein [Actinomycetospora flava]|uniref:Uncharacterized protein n=1 Tax=Actinomycetospora flava TaxID=3129232 RepID=A0ABU8M6V4_9PSEU